MCVQLAYRWFKRMRQRVSRAPSTIKYFKARTLFFLYLRYLPFFLCKKALPLTSPRPTPPPHTCTPSSKPPTQWKPPEAIISFCFLPLFSIYIFLLGRKSFTNIYLHVYTYNTHMDANKWSHRSEWRLGAPCGLGGSWSQGRIYGQRKGAANCPP